MSISLMISATDPMLSGHKPFSKEVPGGVEMTDVLHYKIPFGFMGKLVNLLFVRKKVEEIFNFRFQKLEELYNKNWHTVLICYL